MAISIGIGNYIGNRRSVGDSLPKPIARYSAKGKSNTDSDRAILRDLTGNGHDIVLNNFAFNTMSGYGGFGTDFNTWVNGIGSQGTLVRTDSKAICTVNTGVIGNRFRYEGKEAINMTVKLNKPGRITVVLTPISTGVPIYSYYDANGNNVVSINLPALDVSTYSQRWIFFETLPTSAATELTVEQIPLYEDCIVSDGINDFGSCPTFPVLTDYTVISKRTWLNNPVNSSGYFIYVRGVSSTNFVHEYLHKTDNTNKNNIFVRGSDTYSLNSPSLISWQTLSRYNGTNINVGTNPVTQTGLSLFSSSYGTSTKPSAIALYELHVFDRSLTELEIERYIIKYIDPYYYIQPKIHYDFSRQNNDSNNRTTVYDLSGNAINGTLQNFAFSGMSGFGGYVGGNWNAAGGKYPSQGTIVYSDSKLIASLTSAGSTGVQYTEGGFLPQGVLVKVRISGLKTGFKVIIRSSTAVMYNIGTDGVYNLKIDDANVRGFWLEGNEAIDNVVFEQLPLYPDALVFDGVDDRIITTKTANIRTIIMDWVPMSLNMIAYDGRTNFEVMALLTSGIAYVDRNVVGKTYLDGNLNTTVSSVLFNNKHTTVCLTNPNPNINITAIGSTNSTPGLFHTKMALYKFLAFEEELTEEQVNHMMKRYNIYRK